MLRNTLFALLVVLGAALPVTARADDVAEATDLFASGNEHFQRSQRLRGDRQTHELEAALSDYFSSLRIIRSRNVLYNTAIVLEQLARWDECFNYWTEYLGVTGLSDAERADGTTHREAARPHVAVLSITSTPRGADVWIDRRDLASRGHTPLDIAVPAGDRHLYLTAPGHRETEATTSASTGQTQAIEVRLSAMPVSLQVLAPEEGVLTLDDAPLRAGASTDVTPGAHVLRLEVAGAEVVERRFEVVAGAAPMVIDLAGSVRHVVQGTVPLGVHVDADARVLVDGAEASHGTDVIVGVTLGAHDVRLEAPGRAPLTVRGTFTPGSRLQLDAHLAREVDGGVMAMRGIFGIGALVGLGLAIGFSVDAGSQASAYNMIGGQARFDALNDANLRADISWGVSAALGVAAIIAVFVDAGGGESEGRFVIAPTQDGAMLAASGRFGGL